MTNSEPVLTIVTVSYNSYEFVEAMIHAIERFTSNSWCMIICDNGSESSDLNRLRKKVQLHNNISLIERRQSGRGSMGHGEALNILIQDIKTKYGVILDADCIPLVNAWDEFLIKKLNKKIVVAGTPVAINSPGSSPRSRQFPLIFLCLFDVLAIHRLNIDFRPRNISAGEDTGWELEYKCTNAGYLGYGLYGQNTRTYKSGPFRSSICDEYYADASCRTLICSHFGRGSDPTAGKYRFLIGGRRLRHTLDKIRWLTTVRHLIFN